MNSGCVDISSTDLPCCLKQTSLIVQPEYHILVSNVVLALAKLSRCSKHVAVVAQREQEHVKPL